MNYLNIVGVFIGNKIANKLLINQGNLKNNSLLFIKCQIIKIPTSPVQIICQARSFSLLF
uniref:Uncharacterized protein n=1 Tax=viral metagenome TaxID=1070528 RepID=A0A6C0ADN7_9ZZZZ